MGERDLGRLDGNTQETSDTLKFGELEATAMKIYEITSKSEAVTKARKLERQDPVRATAVGLTQLGWDIKSHRFITNHDGKDFDMYFTSPAMLKHKVAERTDDLRWTKAQAAIKHQYWGRSIGTWCSQSLESRRWGRQRKPWFCA